MNGIDRLAQENALPENLFYFSDLAYMWRKKRADIIFRGAPHLLIASAPRGIASPKEDCLIALTTFELFAQAHGVGALWLGYAERAIDVLLPDLKKELGIPASHVFGYAMVFGKPAVHYARTVLHRNPIIHRVI
jgi:nitroreductase